MQDKTALKAERKYGSSDNKYVDLFFFFTWAKTNRVNGVWTSQVLVLLVSNSKCKSQKCIYYLQSQRPGWGGDSLHTRQERKHLERLATAQKCIYYLQSQRPGWGGDSLHTRQERKHLERLATAQKCHRNQWQRHFIHSWLVFEKEDLTQSCSWVSETCVAVVWLLLQITFLCWEIFLISCSNLFWCSTGFRFGSFSFLTKSKTLM